MGLQRGIILLLVLMVSIVAQANADNIQQAAANESGWHPTTEAALRDAVMEKARSDEAKRELLRSVLTDPRVMSAGKKLGLDLRAATDAVATLDGSELDEAAQHAVGMQENLRGGDTIVIGATTVIIVLLIVLIIVAAD